MLHLDSACLIDLIRESNKGRPGPALDFIETLPAKETLAISVHVACELRAGAELSRRPLVEHEALDRLLSGLLIACPDDRFAGIYGRTLAAIERDGRRIGAFDLLIATAALADDAPLVTNNVKHFNAVPGLRIVTY